MTRLLFSGDDNIFAAAIGASAAPNNVVRKFLLFIIIPRPDEEHFLLQCE